MKKKPKLKKLNLKIGTHFLDCLFCQGLDLPTIRKVDRAFRQLKKEVKLYS